MAKLYLELEKPIREHTSAELVQKLSRLNKTQLLRTIIVNERDFPSVQEKRSLRSFWYTSVKITLDKLGLLTEQDQTEKGLQKWSGSLSDVLAEMVHLNFITYKELNIVDNSRRRSVSRVINHTYGDAFLFPVNTAKYNNIIITTEKDTVFDIIQDLSSLFGCSCISGHGQNSLSAMEDLVRKILETKKDIDALYILTMTDYDPAGYYIADTFKKQARTVLENIPLDIPVYIKRLGITPDQLTPEQVEQNKYTPKKANREEWFKKTGGINGEPKGLELDAFPPSQIREIFVKALQLFTEEKELTGFVKESYFRYGVVKMVHNSVDLTIDKLLKQGALNGFELPDPDLPRLGLEGFDRVPVEDMGTPETAAYIQGLVRENFRFDG